MVVVGMGTLFGGIEAGLVFALKVIESLFLQLFLQLFLFLCLSLPPPLPLSI